MPTQDAIGSTVPAPSDPADLPRWVKALSLTSPPIIAVSSTTQANSLRTAYEAECTQAGVTPRTLYVWNDQTDNLERDTGTAWEYVAGRQHGSTSTWSRAAHAAGSVIPINIDSYVRASPGWTTATNGIVVPATGLYIMTCVVQVSGLAENLGRVFGQLQISGTNVPMRMGTAVNEDAYGWTIVWPLSKGQAIRPVHYHEAGGARDITATFQVAMVNAPNW